MKKHSVKLETIQVTQQEIWDATRPNVYKSKKAYTRKQKHRLKNLDEDK